MKINDFRQNLLRQAGACAFVAGGVALSVGGQAATATGTANATVVDSVSVTITVPAPAPAPTPVPTPAVIVTPPVVQGTVFTVESFTSSLSTSGPLLRVGVAPPSGTGGGGAQAGAAADGGPATGNGTAADGGTGAQPGTVTQGGAGAGAAPSVANAATVSVTRRADGSLAASGGSGLTFAVSQPVAGAINIEYN